MRRQSGRQTQCGWVIGVLLSTTVAAANGAGNAKHLESTAAAFKACQSRFVEEVSGRYATIEEAALALTNRCLESYQALIGAMARNQFDGNNERRMFRIEQDSRQLKVDASKAAVSRMRASQGNQ